MQTSIARITPILVLAAVFSAWAEDKPAEAPKETLLKVERGELQIVIEADGSIDAGRKKKVKILPAEYGGPYTVLEIATNSQTVESGATLLRLDSAPLERLIRSTQENLDGMKTRLQSGQEEYEVMKTSNRQKTERMTIDLTAATRDQKSFDKFGEELMVKSRELMLKNYESYLVDREEELKQLESMYKETQLATETKEIVLERTRRSVALIKEQIELIRKSDRQMREYDLPTRKENLGNSIQQRRQDFDLFQTAMRLGEAAKADDLQRTQRQIRDTQEYLARLESDLPKMNVPAPFTGVVVNRGAEVNDKANPFTVVLELLDLSQYELKFQLTAKELKAVKVGTKFKLHLADLPELDLEGKIEEIGMIPTPDSLEKGVTRFPVRAKIDGDKQLRPALKAKVEISGHKVDKALQIPRTAVINEDNRTYCNIRHDDKTEKKEVVLGLGNREQVEVVKGLSSGDVVVVPPGKK